MEIKVNDYVRLKNGVIGTIIEIKTVSTNMRGEHAYAYKLGKTKKYNSCWVEDYAIVKHSSNLIDLIEVGDILKLKDGEKWEVQEHQGDGNWIQTEWEVIENEEDLKNKVDSIVTKEQFSSLEYII